jgi:hypothetical protein
MAVSSNWKLVGALSAALLAAACGDDDKKEEGPQNGDDAAAPRPDAGLVTPGGNTTAQLGPGVVGKACTSDGECTGKGGDCVDRLTLGSLGAIAESIVGQSIFLNNPGGYCSATCMSDTSCGAEGVCFGALAGISSGDCRKKCAADGDCRQDYECAKSGTVGGGDAGMAITIPLPSTCQPRIKPTPLAANTIGKACTAENAATVCGAGAACTAGACSGVCLVDGDCGTGAKCNLVPFYGTLGLCSETCTQDADCNQFSGDTGRVGCNTAQGVCGPKVFPLSPGVVGKECADRAQCGGSAECAMMLGSGQQARPAPGGYCSLQGCSMSAQCGGGTCTGSVLAGSRCYKSCTADGDCRSGYTCQDRMSIENSPAKICAPAAAPAATPDAGAPRPDAG